MNIGIDLGTTFSVIAVKGDVTLAPSYPGRDGRVYLPEVDVTVIPTPDGNPLFPSIVWVNPENPNEYVVGDEARQAIEQGECPIQWSKRCIGTTQKLRLKDRTLTAKDAAREILRYLKRCAEWALDRPITRAVVTHPAWFDPGQVAETKQAAEEVGFDMSLPEQTMMEPIAAALAYTISDPRDPLTVMVYDLGGGTFDISVLERRGGFIDCKAFDGNHLLGGYNFDRKLVQWVLDHLQAKGRAIPYDENDPACRSRRAKLLLIAEQVKIDLSKQHTDRAYIQFQAPNVLVDDAGKPVRVLERISRAEFAALIKDELDETIVCCRRALEKAGKKIEEIDELLLAGSSTHGPWVAEAIRRGLGKEPKPTFAPDLIVAVGAALQAVRLPAPPVRTQAFDLELDVPATCTLDQITIRGSLRAAGAHPLPELTVHLHSPQGDSCPAVRPGASGSFLFENVRLLENGPTRFTLEVVAADGVTHLKHEFSVTYCPDDPNVGDFLPILPKVLYLRTPEGMVPLAEQGQKLPARCEVPTLERLFDGDTYDEPIYLGDQRVGYVRVKDIPKEAGAGAKIKFELEVTAKGQIRGKVQIATRTGTVIKDAEVKISFPPLPVPTEGELRREFQRLEDKRHDLMVLTEDAELRTLLAGKGARLAKAAEDKFREQEPNRQELQVLLRDLDRLVNPPPDDMEPPRAHFDSLIVTCRELLAEHKDDPQIQAFGATVDRCEREGHDAYLRKDRRRWMALNDSLAHLRATLEAGPEDKTKRPKPTLPETPILKDQAGMAVEAVVAKLSAMENSLNTDPDYESTFRPRCTAVKAKLDAIKARIQAIPDQTPKEQAIGKIQLVLRDLGKVEHAEIPRIPFHVTKGG